MVLEAAGFVKQQLSANNRQLLKNAGSISRQQAVKKAVTQYRQYEAKNLSSVEEAYLASIKAITKKAKQ